MDGLPPEMLLINPATVIAAVLTLAPLIGAAFFRDTLLLWVSKLPGWMRLLCPAGLCVPYVLVASWGGAFRWEWFGLYAALPVMVAGLMWQARRADAEQRGNWRDFLVLAVLGLAVDLRWFEGAWPAHMAVFNKMLLVDAGIYGIGFVRQLEGVGFDLRLRLRDLGIGLREFGWYAPVAIGLGLLLGFLHWHAAWPGVGKISIAFVFTFLFIAVPEELFSGDGRRICWNAGWDGFPLCSARRPCSAFRISISGRCTSTGGMCCWPRWLGWHMAEPGGRIGGWVRLR